MGVPEMHARWIKLQTGFREGSLSKDDNGLYKKWGKALKLLSEDPMHTGLRTHEIDALSRRYGMKVWQSYLENKKSSAMRMYWVYGPERGEITIIGLEPHPEDSKRGGYDKVRLSNMDENGYT